jgi:hypothetical protein
MGSTLTLSRTLKEETPEARRYTQTMDTSGSQSEPTEQTVTDQIGSQADGQRQPRVGCGRSAPVEPRSPPSKVPYLRRHRTQYTGQYPANLAYRAVSCSSIAGIRLASCRREISASDRMPITPPILTELPGAGSLGGCTSEGTCGRRHPAALRLLRLGDRPAMSYILRCLVGGKSPAPISTSICSVLGPVGV